MRNWSVIPTVTYRTGRPTINHDTGETESVSETRLMGSCDADHPWAVPVLGALIRDDDRGILYETGLDQHNQLTSLTINVIEPGAKIDPHRLPLQRLTDQTIECLASIESEDTGQDDDVRRIIRALSKDTAYEAPKSGPTVEQVAADYNGGLRRKAIHAKYKNTKWQTSQGTIDRRLSEARLLSLIGPAETGRPPSRTRSSKKPTTSN